MRSRQPLEALAAPPCRLGEAKQPSHPLPLTRRSQAPPAAMSQSIYAAAYVSAAPGLLPPHCGEQCIQLPPIRSTSEPAHRRASKRLTAPAAGQASARTVALLRGSAAMETPHVMTQRRPTRSADQAEARTTGKPAQSLQIAATHEVSLEQQMLAMMLLNVPLLSMPDAPNPPGARLHSLFLVLLHVLSNRIARSALIWLRRGGLPAACATSQFWTHPDFLSAVSAQESPLHPDQSSRQCLDAAASWCSSTGWARAPAARARRRGGSEGQHDQPCQGCKAAHARRGCHAGARRRGGESAGARSCNSLALCEGARTAATGTRCCHGSETGPHRRKGTAVRRSAVNNDNGERQVARQRRMFGFW